MVMRHLRYKLFHRFPNQSINTVKLGIVAPFSVYEQCKSLFQLSAGSTSYFHMT